MYPPPPPSSSSSSSSCSSSHGSMAPTDGSGNLTRYGSAPSSLLSSPVDSINAQFRSPHTTLAGPTLNHYFSSDTESKANIGGLQRSYCFNNVAAAAAASSNHLKSSGESSSLVRHSSSPAGFLNRLATATSDNVSRGLAVYNSKGGSDTAHGISRLNSQLSFTKDCLSQISEESENVDDGHRKETHSYATANFGMGSWDDTNAVMFSPSPSKRAKSINTDISNGFNIVESQLQFGLPETALEMATMENLIDIPQDSIPCRIRAKRGCATHPRSIAERERRTRISGKLKKLQDLVPNMDKQTSYADMLDLAVQHIKGLQTQVEKLHEEVENCTCGCR